jgi:hypothetical protein
MNIPLTIGPRLPGVNHCGRNIEPGKGISREHWLRLAAAATLSAKHKGTGLTVRE